jgi:hypothetical protein
MEFFRLNYGYKANLGESFPNLLFFILFTVVFSIPCMVMMVIGEQVIPIDIATAGIELIFILTELFLSCSAIKKVTKKQSAVFYLRNTSTRITSQDNEIKSSREIEEELFYNHPGIHKKYLHNKHN